MRLCGVGLIRNCIIMYRRRYNLSLHGFRSLIAITVNLELTQNRRNSKANHQHDRYNYTLIVCFISTGTCICGNGLPFIRWSWNSVVAFSFWVSPTASWILRRSNSHTWHTSCLGELILMWGTHWDHTSLKDDKPSGLAPLSSQPLRYTMWMLCLVSLHGRNTGGAVSWPREAAGCGRPYCSA